MHHGRLPRLCRTAGFLLCTALLVLPTAFAGWEAPEGDPYAAEARTLLEEPAHRSSLAFRGGVLAWTETPWSAMGPDTMRPDRVAYLDTRSGASANTRVDGSDAMPGATGAGFPAVGASHIVWLQLPGDGNIHSPSGSIHAVAIGSREPFLLHPSGDARVTPPHVLDTVAAWGTSRPWNETQPWIHLADLATGESRSLRFPLQGTESHVWPAPVGAYVLLHTGLYHWDLAGTPTLLTAEPANGFQLTVEAGRAFWTQYREGEGRGTNLYSFDLLARQEERVTFSPGREHQPAASGGLVTWMDLRREDPCGRDSCPTRYNLYFQDLVSRNEYRLEGTWNVSAGPALDGRQLAYNDAEGRLRVATLPAPSELLVASVVATVEEAAEEEPGHVLKLDLAAPGRVAQHWDTDLDGAFETAGPLEVVLPADNPAPLHAVVGHAVDQAGRTAAVSVNVAAALRAAEAKLPARNEPQPPPPGPSLPPADEPVQPPAEPAAPPPAAEPAVEQVRAVVEETLVDALPILQQPAHEQPQAHVLGDTETLEATPPLTQGMPPAALAASLAVGTLGAGATAAVALQPGWLRRLLPLGLFSRLDPRAALDHPVRAHIASLVRAHPGIHYQELVRHVKRGHGVVDHHLRALQKAGILVQRTHGRYTCFFHRDGTPNPVLQQALAALRAQGARGVLAALGQSGMPGRDLAQELRLAPTTVGYHLQRLEQAGLVARQWTGERTLYGLTPLGRQALSHAS